MVWSQPSTLSLRTLLPDPTQVTHTDVLRLPKAVAIGTYSITLRIVDPKGYRPPMRLAIADSPTPTGYAMGAMEVR